MTSKQILQISQKYEEDEQAQVVLFELHMYIMCFHSICTTDPI